MLLEILVIVIMIIVCIILYELAKMTPLEWHPLHLVDNTDTLYLGDWRHCFFFFRFLFFCVHKFAYVSVSLSVGLFAIHLKFKKNCCYEIPSDLSVKKQ